MKAANILQKSVPSAYNAHMADEPGSLVRRYLRRIDEKIDNLTGKAGELVVRVSALERDVAALQVDLAAMTARMDQIDRRLDRAEKRLERAEV